MNGWILIYPRTDYVDGKYIPQEGPPLRRRLTDEEQKAVRDIHKAVRS